MLKDRKLRAWAARMAPVLRSANSSPRTVSRSTPQATSTSARSASPTGRRAFPTRRCPPSCAVSRSWRRWLTEACSARSRARGNFRMAYIGENCMNSRHYALLAALLLVVAAGEDSRGQTQDRQAPIVLAKSGGFVIGGKVLADPKGPGHLSCDHGYIEYFLPANPRSTSLVMWHSSSTQVWQNRWDGGEGFKDMFLRRDYPVYLWDGPRVGRANWSCEPIPYTPEYRDEGNFTAWNFGPSYKNWWPDVQFPTGNEQAWKEATASRYDEFDFLKNIQLETDAAAVAADSGRLGGNIVYLTNSAGGLRAMVTTGKTTKDNIAGIVAYESIGYVFPIGDPESPKL